MLAWNKHWTPLCSYLSETRHCLFFTDVAWPFYLVCTNNDQNLTFSQILEVFELWTSMNFLLVLHIYPQNVHFSIKLKDHFLDESSFRSTQNELLLKKQVFKFVVIQVLLRRLSLDTVLENAPNGLKYRDWKHSFGTRIRFPSVGFHWMAMF